MNPLHQLTRRPVKAAFGVLLLALAGAILCLSGGQYWAAAQTRAAVEENYTTVAVVTGGMQQLVASGGTVRVDIGATYEANAFLQKPAQRNWSIVRGQATMGLVSGYSPQLSSLSNFYASTADISDTRVDDFPNVPYDFAVLEVEITQVGPETASYADESTKENTSYDWAVDGKVLSVQAMHPDWDDPTGRNIHFFLQIRGASDAAGKAIQPGQRCLLFTHSYRDLDFEQRMRIAQNLMSDSRNGEEIDPRSLDIEGNLIRYADRQKIIEAIDGNGNPLSDDTPLYRDPVTGQEEALVADWFHTISCNVTDMSQPWMEYNWNEKTQEYEVRRVIHFDTDYDLASFTLLPDGVTAEELIASSPTWQKAVEAIRVSDHSVPVLAVNHLEAVADFASGRAQITQGRGISQEEYRDGAAVCLISESLSRESGLNVGDTLPLSLYEFDRDLPYSYLTECNPRSFLYLPDRGFQQETEYTVIGLYRQSSEWVTTPTSFTPNSVFVPEKSVTCQTVSGGYGVWETMILKNGTAGQMEARLKENGLGGVVTYYDQGYSEIVESLDGFSRVSRTVLWVGLALWVVVLAAYCVLFPLQEGKTALRMWTLGTVKRDITGSIWLSSAAVAVIGTVIALAVSIPGMSWAIGKLQELTGSELTMSVSPWQTAALCAVVLVLELAAVALCSALAARRGIRKAA